MLGVDPRDDLDVGSSPEPRSFVPSPSSTWKIPALLDITISTRTAVSSPGLICTSSIAYADSEWMFGRRVSNGTRERPRAMSSASATRTIAPSIVNGSPRRRWEMIACSASDTTIVRFGSL